MCALVIFSPLHLHPHIIPFETISVDLLKLCGRIKQLIALLVFVGFLSCFMICLTYFSLCAFANVGTLLKARTSSRVDREWQWIDNDIPISRHPWRSTGAEMKQYILLCVTIIKSTLGVVGGARIEHCAILSPSPVSPVCARIFSLSAL